MPDPKTVLHVQHYPDGGSVTSLLDLVGGLDPARYRPVVCFRDRSPFVAEFEAAGIHVECLFDDPPAPGTSPSPPTPPRAQVARSARRVAVARKELRRAWRRDLPAVRRLVAVARRHGADLIHANNDVRVNRDALAASALLRIPAVVHVRWLYDSPPRLTLAIDALAARRAARFFFISEAVRDAYKPARDPFKQGVVLDNPFHVDAYRGDPPAGLRSSLGVDGTDAVVVHVGRLTRWKGQDVLIRAAADLRGRGRRVQVLLVGQTGDARSQAFAAELEALADELGVQDQVRFLGARRDIPALLAIADVVVHSSTEPEPFGRVVVEAMATGRPVVAADGGGVREIVDDGETGLLVRSGRADLLADAIDRLLADPEAARAMADRGRRAAQRRFSVERHVAVVQAHYDEVLAFAARP